MATVKNTEQLINENAEGAELFVKLEDYSNRHPDAFAFFCNKYQTILYDNFPWAEVLFRFDQRSAGVLDKYIPYVSAVLSLIVLILLMVKK